MALTGWCDPEKEKANNSNRSEPIADQPTFFDGGQQRVIDISGHVDPKDPDTLQGTLTDTDPVLPNSLGTRSGQTIITWRLRRASTPARK